MSFKTKVLVTGASGFIGSHIVSRLLQDEEYDVRLTARGAKVDMIRNGIAKNNPRIEIVEVADIMKDDLTGPLKDVDAIIHVAAPLAGRATPADTLDISINGTLNILKQAEKAGVKRFVLTSSFGTACDPDMKECWVGKTFTENDWGSATAEQVTDGTRNPLWVYLACKTIAEKTAWEFASQHKGLELVTINAPFVYGPFVKDFPLPKATELGTNGFIYRLIAGEKNRPLPVQLLVTYFINVKDIALAHVRALKVTNTEGRKKRFLVSGAAFTWKDAVKHLQSSHPGLADRLPSLQNEFKPPGPLSTIDTSLAEKYLGIPSWIGWKETVDETVDALLEAEKSWA